MQTNANNFKNFSPEQLLFATTLADPNEGRTQAEIAASLGVHPTTLCRWKKEPGFGDLIWELTYRNLEAETGRVSSTLLGKALQGDIRSIRLFFELLGKIGPQKASTVSVASTHAVSDEEIAETLKSELTEQELRRWVGSMKKEYGIGDYNADNSEGLIGSEEIHIDDAVCLQTA